MKENKDKYIEEVRSLLDSLTKTTGVEWSEFPQDNDLIDIDGWITIAPTTLTVQTLVGPKEVPGYEVVGFVPVYNYPAEPDDVDEVSLGTAQRIEDAIALAFTAASNHRINQCVSNWSEHRAAVEYSA